MPRCRISFFLRLVPTVLLVFGMASLSPWDEVALAQGDGRWEFLCVPHGGLVSQESAATLARAAALLQGWDKAAMTLNDISTVRLASLDRLQRQALALLLGMARVNAQGPDDLPPPDGEEQGACVSLRAERADLAALPLWLGQDEQLQRHMEVIAALQHLTPQGLDLIDIARIRRGPETFIHARLEGVVARIEALLRYLELLPRFAGAWSQPEETLAALDNILGLVPAQELALLPLVLAQAEILLHQGRPGAALRRLERANLVERKNERQDERRLPDSPEQRVKTALRVRALYLRALAHLGAGHAGLAEADLNAALALAPERADLWLARGALRQASHQEAAMCPDYYRACSLGLCEGLQSARAAGHCADAEGGPP